MSTRPARLGALLLGQPTASAGALAPAAARCERRALRPVALEALDAGRRRRPARRWCPSCPDAAGAWRSSASRDRGPRSSATCATWSRCAARAPGRDAAGGRRRRAAVAGAPRRARRGPPIEITVRVGARPHDLPGAAGQLATWPARGRPRSSATPATASPGCASPAARRPAELDARLARLATRRPRARQGYAGGRVGAARHRRARDAALGRRRAIRSAGASRRHGIRAPS